MLVRCQAQVQSRSNTEWLGTLNTLDQRSMSWGLGVVRGYKGSSVHGCEGECVLILGLFTVYEASTLSSRPACEVSVTRGHASTAFLSSQVFRPQYPVPGTIGPEVRHGAQPLVPTSLFIPLAAKWRAQSQALSSLLISQRSSSNVVSLLPAQSPTPALSLGRLQRKSRNPDP